MTDMEIETFLTVLRSGSMTAAAQALYITQPTLSARLQTLEDEVGRRCLSGARACGGWS